MHSAWAVGVSDEKSIKPSTRRLSQLAEPFPQVVQTIPPTNPKEHIHTFEAHQAVQSALLQKLLWGSLCCVAVGARSC